MRYKINDKVIIREDLSKWSVYPNLDYTEYETVASEMCKLGGKIATIKNIIGSGLYHIDLDNGQWKWTDAMFENNDKSSFLSFQKVSFKQYCKDCGYSDKFGDDLMEGIRDEYENIKMPRRATEGSYGYDFFMPFDIQLEPNEAVVIPTGIKWRAPRMEFSAFMYSFVTALKFYPRSGLGFKYQLGMANTVPIIDSDYYNNKNNEGHIMIKLVNNGDEQVVLKAGQGFVQCAVELSLTDCDYDRQFDTEERTGGFGSTDKK